MCVGSDGENAAQMLTGSSGVLPQFPRGSWGLSSTHRTEAVLQILERILRWKREMQSEILFKIEKKKNDAPKLEVKSQKGLTLVVFSFLALYTW